MARKKQQTVTVTAKDKQIAKAIAEGASYKDALAAAGYAATTCEKGRNGLTAGARAALAKELAARGVKFEEIGKEYADPARIENLMAGRLIDNVMSGVDAGVQSVKALGTMTRAGSAMRPEIGAGIIVVQMPESLARKPDPEELALEERLILPPPALLGGDENYECVNGQFVWKGVRYQAGNPSATVSHVEITSEQILEENLDGESH